MDFTQIPWLETALNWTIGGVSIFTILVIATKIVGWLKTNNLSALMQNFVETIAGKEINIDLTVLAEKKFAELNKKVDAKLKSLDIKINAQSNVLVDIADIVSGSKLASEAQKGRIKQDSEPIRTSEPAPAREVVKVKLEPVKLQRELENTESKIYID